MTDALNRISERVQNYYHIDSNTPYSIEKLPAIDFIVPQRLDVIIKVYYVEAKVNGYNMDFAKELYSKHISSITRFTNSENGQKDKNSIEAFFEVFDKLIESFSREGFNDEVSLIPISSDGIILDGAHRLACAIYFKKEISVIRFKHIKSGNEIHPPIYDYNYFKGHLLEQKYLDVAVQWYLKYSKKNIYIACIWPAANDLKKRVAAIQLIKEKYPVIAQKDILMSFFAFDRFVAQVYMHDDWVGTIENNFSGSSGKSKLTYKEGVATSFVLFEGSCKEETLQLKDEVRTIFNIEKHSIHITDNNTQTQFIVDIVFNQNSILYIKYAHPEKFRNDVAKLFKLNNGQLLGLPAATTTWGIAPLQAEDLELKQCHLKEGYSVSAINSLPNAYFCYLGMKMIMPEIKIVEKFYQGVNSCKLLSFSQLHDKRFEKIRYRIKIWIFLIRSSLYGFVGRHPSILNIARKIKNR